MIFSQQVIGYPRRRDVTLTCELFGLAGHYVLTLRSKLYSAVPVMHSEPAHMKVPPLLLRCNVIARFGLRPEQNM